MRFGNEGGVKNNGVWCFIVFDGEKEDIWVGGKENVDFSKIWRLWLCIDGM